MCYRISFLKKKRQNKTKKQWLEANVFIFLPQARLSLLWCSLSFSDGSSLQHPQLRPRPALSLAVWAGSLCFLDCGRREGERGNGRECTCRLLRHIRSCHIEYPLMFCWPERRHQRKKYWEMARLSWVHVYSTKGITWDGERIDSGEQRAVSSFVIGFIVYRAFSKRTKTVTRLYV